MISLIPTVHPFNKRKLFIIFWQFPKNSIVFCGDTSVQILCTIPPLEAPTVFLQIIPWINSPFLIWTKLSIKLSLSANSSGVSSLNLVRFNFSGRIKLNICFPDHKGLGFIIQGIGKSLISKSSIHIIKLLTWSYVKKLSLSVKTLQPIKVSWTIPITGLLDWGDTICLGTCIMFIISDFDSSDWGRCKFISSPSKSALYGVVTDKFNRKVE